MFPAGNDNDTLRRYDAGDALHGLLEHGPVAENIKELFWQC
jgi:hypothetical protein